MSTEYIFPVRPTVHPNESILGYLKRLADAFRLESVSLLGEKAGLPTPLKDTTVVVNPSSLAISLGDRWQALSEGHFRPVGAKYEYGNNALPLEYLHLNTMRVCRDCLKEEPYHRHFWHFAPIGTCHVHGTTLYDTCPNCAADLTWGSPKITTCPQCDNSILNTEAIKQPSAAMQVARCLLQIGGLISVDSTTVVPPVLNGLSLADTVAFLEFLGRLASWQETDERRSMPEYVTAGYTAALDWPASFRKALAALEEHNRDLGRSPFTLFHPFYREIIKVPFASWGGRVQSALINYLAYRDDILLDTRHPLSEHVFRMRRYCPEEQVLELLRIDKEGLRRLRGSSSWSVHTHEHEGREVFKIGHVIELRERLTKDVLGFHSRPYLVRDYENWTPLQLGLPEWPKRKRKKPVKDQV